MRLLMTLMLALMLAACGNDHSHDADGGHHDGGEQHGHGDEHGEAHPIGHADIEDGYHVGAARVGELEAGKEGVFEIHVRKDGKDLTNATVIGWLVDGEGKEVTRRESGEFMSEEKVYDLHMTLPPEMKEGMVLHVRIRHEQTDQTATIPLK